MMGSFNPFGGDPSWEDLKVIFSPMTCGVQGNDLNLISRPFMGFGKELIKKCRIHPDTFVQLAVQLAYFSQHGK